MPKEKLYPYPAIGDFNTDFSESGIATFNIGHYQLDEDKTVVYLDRIRKSGKLDIVNDVLVAGYLIRRKRWFFRGDKIRAIPFNEQDEVKSKLLMALKSKKERKIEFSGFWD